MPDDDARLTGVVVPDDISALARDVATYRREVRRSARARRVRALVARRGVVPGLVLTAAGLFAALVALMLTVLGPRPAAPAPAATTLAAPAVAAGGVGGLLPHATLYAQDGTPIDSHNPVLRPQIFALVPPHCDCGRLLNDLSAVAYSESLRLGIVVPSAVDDTSANGIIDSLDRGLPSVYFDPQLTLARSVSASGVTAVVVDEDGTIYAVVRDITDPARTTLVAQMQSMVLADQR